MCDASVGSGGLTNSVPMRYFWMAFYSKTPSFLFQAMLSVIFPDFFKYLT